MKRRLLPILMTLVLARHREILSAIHRQDDAAAKQAMREHTRAAATDLKV